MPYPALLALALLAQADPTEPRARPAITPEEIVSALESSVADAIARAEGSVVAITREKNDNAEETTAVRGKLPPPEPPGVFHQNAFGELSAPDYVAMPGDYGSGVVVGERGEIVTAYHLLKGAKRIRVRAAGRQEFDAEIIAADPRSDLAAIAPRAIPGASPPKLKPLALGDASKLRKGSFLVVLGNPYNAAKDGRPSASWGILSNVARKLDPPEDRLTTTRTLQLRHQPSLMQLDAKLNLGLSGGAVINLKGELVGVTTTAGNPSSFDAQAGYAIPMDALGRRILESLRQGKEVEYGFLGISLDPKSSNRVAGCRAGTPAAQAGLVAGDVIVAVGDKPVPEDGLGVSLSAVPAGATVKLSVLRDGQVLEKTVTVAKFPVEGPIIATSRPEAWRGARVDFTSVLTLALWDDETAQQLGNGGVGVVEVESGSPTDAAGLKRGQVVTHVDGRPIRSPSDFYKSVANRKGPVTLTTELGGEAEKKIVVK
jgi:S1-C subfamily serine protease